jgi:hypothetical protein
MHNLLNKVLGWNWSLGDRSRETNQDRPILATINTPARASIDVSRRFAATRQFQTESRQDLGCPSIPTGRATVLPSLHAGKDS